MILKRLCEYWEREGGGLHSGYKNSFLTKRIVVSRDGRSHVVPLTGQTSAKKEGKWVAVPREQPQRTSAVKARLVHDNPNYALGLAGEEDDPSKITAKHEAYVALLRKCAEKTGEPSISTLLSWIESGGPKAANILAGIDPVNDEILFEVDGENPTDKASVREFWSAKEGGVTGTCLITGVLTTVAARMPYPIKGVRGGQSSGTMLISVNNPSGESYGLGAALNSPIGESSAEAVCNALNQLLNDRAHSLYVGETTYVFWTRRPTTFDFKSFLDDPKPEDVRTLLGAPKIGAALPDLEPNDFYVIALSANMSRIVIRDFLETTVERVQAALASWYARLTLVGMDGDATPPFGIYRLASSLYREAKDVPNHVPVELMRSALTGLPVPNALLMLAVKRNLAMQGPYFELNKKRFLSMPRLCLVKACLLATQSQTEDQTLTSLDREHREAAYHCGRLLAVLESIQKLAIPGLNATLVDRNYGATSASPAVTFGGLIKDATSAHLPKLRKDSPGAFRALDSRLIEVLERIEPEFPKTLDYRQQGQFALGYYHQRAADIAAARANKELRAIAAAQEGETE